MRFDLWVIWTAICVLVFTVGMAAEHWLFRPDDEPTAPDELHGAARSATSIIGAADLEAGPRSRNITGAGLSGGPPWPDVTEPDLLNPTMVPWTDTPDHLEHLAARYYPPPEEEDFPGSPVFDQLAAQYLAAHETSAPAPVAGPPPGGREAGAEPDPPAPVPSAPGSAEGATPSAGAGADPWQEIASHLNEDPDLNQWSIGAELSRCHEIVRELHDLGKALKAPYQLTPWKGATA